MFLSKSFQRNISCLVFCCYICIKLKVLWYKKNHTIKDLHKTNKLNEGTALNQTGTQIVRYPRLGTQSERWMEAMPMDPSLCMVLCPAAPPTVARLITPIPSVSLSTAHWATLGQVLG